MEDSQEKDYSFLGNVWKNLYVCVLKIISENVNVRKFS